MLCYLCRRQVRKVRSIYICEACGLGESEHYFDPTIYTKRYHTNFVERGVSEFGRRLSIFRMGLLAPYCSDKSTVLDYGCATGAFLSLIESVVSSVEGIEINKHARVFAKKHYGLKVYKDLKKKISYDIITMFDVIEHFETPRSKISEIHNHLKSEGYFVITTPNFAVRRYFPNIKDWKHYKPREHLFYFDRPSLSSLLSQCGFKMIECHYRESLMRRDYNGLNILTVVAQKC